MKESRFKNTLVLGFVFSLPLFVVSGKGGGNSIFMGNGNELSEVLPFGLNRMDANVVSRIAVWVRLAPQIALSDKRSGVVRNQEEYEGAQDGSSNPILLEFKAPECSTGSIKVIDNKPDFTRLNDLKDGEPSWSKTIVSEVVANDCYLEDGRVFIGGHARSKVENGDVDIYKREYDDFIYEPYIQGGDKDNIEGRFVAITGKSTYIDTDMNKANGKLEVRLPHDIYTHSSGSKLVLDGFTYKATKLSGVTRVTSFSYNAKWAVGDVEKGLMFLKYGISEVVGVDPRREYLPKGIYDLSLKVTSPLVYESSGTEGAIHSVSSGSVELNLASHGVQAAITYHSGYADVTFKRNGKVEKTRFDLRWNRLE